MGETRKCFLLIHTILKVLGLYPISESDNIIIFRWYSFSTLCSLLSIVIALVSFSLNVHKRLQMDYVLINFAYDVSGLFIQLSFILMAKHWPELGNECDKSDFYMASYGFPKRLKLKAHIICVIFTIVALTVYCTLDSFLPFSSSFKAVLITNIENIGRNPSFATAFNFLLKIATKISHIQRELLRDLVDVYIITVSMVLAARLSQIAEHIGSLIDRGIQNEEAWMHLRQNYQRLCAFIDNWDKTLGYLVLSSFASNLYLILLQIQILLSTANTNNVNVHRVTLVTCLYIFLRYMIVCYTAGNVYAEGTKLIENIVLTPPDVYNAEIERIIVQLRQSRPALTGKQLFTLKHSLIIQLLGGIASHEIIILQYYKPTKDIK